MRLKMVSLIFGFALLLALSTYAQEPVEPLPTEELPTAPVVTETPIPTAIELPTATDTPQSSVTESASPTATATVTPSLTPTSTLIITEALSASETSAFTATPTVDITATSSDLDSVLPVLFAENFEDYAAHSYLGTTDSLIATEYGYSLQLSRTSPINPFGPGSLTDVKAQASFRIDATPIQIMVRHSGAGGYRAVLTPSGTLSLYRNSLLLGTTIVSELTTGQWYNFSLSALGNTLQVMLDGNEILSVVDSEPLFVGTVNFSAENPSEFVLVDNVEIRGIVEESIQPIIDFSEFATGEPFSLMTSTTSEIVFGWTKDSAADPTVGTQLYVMGEDGSNLRRISNTSASYSYPEWSPDGSKIAFVANIFGSMDLFTINADGSGLTRLTFDSASEASPTWSPDGAWIAYDTDLHGANNREIYRIHSNGSDGGVGQRLTTTANGVSDNGPSWSHVSGRIVFFHANAVWTMDGNGSLKEPLYEGETGLSEADWSPDGTRIAFNWTFIIDADGTDLHQVINPPDQFYHSPSWSYDNQRMVHIFNEYAQQTNYIGILNVATGVNYSVIPQGEYVNFLNYEEMYPDWGPAQLIPPTPTPTMTPTLPVCSEGGAGGAESMAEPVCEPAGPLAVSITVSGVSITTSGQHVSLQVIPNSLLTFQITIENQTSDPIPQAELAGNLEFTVGPAFTIASVGGGSPSGNTVSWNLVNLNGQDGVSNYVLTPGETKTVTVTALTQSSVVDNFEVEIVNGLHTPSGLQIPFTFNRTFSIELPITLIDFDDERLKSVMFWGIFIETSEDEYHSGNDVVVNSFYDGIDPNQFMSFLLSTPYCIASPTAPLGGTNNGPGELLPGPPENAWDSSIVAISHCDPPDHRTFYVHAIINNFINTERAIGTDRIMEYLIASGDDVSWSASYGTPSYPVWLDIDTCISLPYPSYAEARNAYYAGNRDAISNWLHEYLNCQRGLAGSIQTGIEPAPEVIARRLYFQNVYPNIMSEIDLAVANLANDPTSGVTQLKQVNLAGAAGEFRTVIGDLAIITNENARTEYNSHIVQIRPYDPTLPTILRPTIRAELSYITDDDIYESGRASWYTFSFQRGLTNFQR